MTKTQFAGVQLSPARRRRVLFDCRRQLTEWGMKMPRVEPLILDFGLGQFSKTGLTEFWLANETEAGYCGKFLFVFDGQTCPYHRHKIKHEIFFAVKGVTKMKVSGKTRILKPGDTLVMPIGVGHSFQGMGPALLLEASQPCLPGDSFFRDRRIGENGVI